MKRVLMIAYHFPPLAGSSGVQRTLRFVQHLPAFGWQPLVLSTHPRAYERTASDLLADIPRDTVVRRAFALDTARHLSFGGRYVAAMARPDRWVSWRFDAVRQGMRLIREFKPDVLWSTYPIPTAHIIGAELNHRSGIPWVADFRDPMAQEGYPADPATWQLYQAIERRTIEKARLCMFTTPGAARTYRARYPQAAERIGILENGYDEDTFASAESMLASPQPLNPGSITLLHSGIVYPSERDPTQLFAALRRLLLSGFLQPGTLKLRFRAAVHDQLINRLANEYGIADFIETLEPIPYREALLEMLRADGLLVLQDAGCNEQIPAKIYEYLRARRPVLCLSDPLGDTGWVLRNAGVEHVAALESADGIESVTRDFLIAVRSGTAAGPSMKAVDEASRRERSSDLAHQLDRILN